MKILNKQLLLVCLGMALVHTSASAIDSVSGEVATGNRSQFVRAGAQWNWDNEWYKSNGTFIGGYWDATLTEWRNNAYKGVPGDTQNITDIGITPVFRFQNDSRKGLYGEAAMVFICFHTFTTITIASFQQHSSLGITWALAMCLTMVGIWL